MNAIDGSPARLIIYKDKIILDNPCTLHYVGRITPENLVPYARNPVICRFMIQLGRFDQLGSGVTNIHKYLPLYAKGAMPVFEETQHGFRLTMPLKPSTQNDGVHDGVHEHLSATELKILQFLATPKSTPELLEGLGYKTRTRNYETAIRRLLDISCIEYTIPEKPRSKNQKYRLAAKGRTLKRSHQ